MPYYIHPKNVDIATVDIWDDIPVFYTAAEANTEMSIALRQTHKVSFRASNDESRDFRTREMSRYSNSEYTEVPWCDKYGDSIQPEHYAHLSVKTPGLIAFTKSIEHGVQDRQTSMRPGKYLQEFYNGQFDAETIAQYIGACAAEHMELKIARTVDDVVAVYMNRGITSCMDGNHFGRASSHPCRVYGDSDLGVAYYGPIDAINARAVVWPDKMRYSRLYGNTAVLESLLKANGWSKGELDGARIRAIEHGNGGWVIPYIDYVAGAELDGKWLVLGEGDISTSETQGYTDGNRYSECEHCNCQIDEDENLCDNCQNQHATCDTCECDIWTNDDEHTSTINGVLCESCADTATLTCAIDDCDETWINAAVFSNRQQRERTAAHTQDLCSACADRYIVCPECDEAIDPAELENPSVCDCGHTFRCELTADLPLPPMDEPCHDNSTWHGPDVRPPVAWDDPVHYNTVPHTCCCARNCFVNAVHNLGTSDQGCAAHYNTPDIAHLITQNGVNLCVSPF